MGLPLGAKKSDRSCARRCDLVERSGKIGAPPVATYALVAGKLQWVCDGCFCDGFVVRGCFCGGFMLFCGIFLLWW